MDTFLKYSIIFSSICILYELWSRVILPFDGKFSLNLKGISIYYDYIFADPDLERIRKHVSINFQNVAKNYFDERQVLPFLVSKKDRN